VLALAIAAIAILAISLSFRERDIPITVAAVHLSMLVTSMQAKTSYRMQGAEVTATQFPVIFAVAKELQQRFQARRIGGTCSVRRWDIFASGIRG
jgi:hypothetical protein